MISQRLYFPRDALKARRVTNDRPCRDMAERTTRQAANFSISLRFPPSAFACPPSRPSPVYLALYLVTLRIRCHPSKAKYARLFIDSKVCRATCAREGGPKIKVCPSVIEMYRSSDFQIPQLILLLLFAPITGLFSRCLDCF